MTSELEHRRRAWLATLCALLVIAAFLAAKAARDAILLSQFSVENLPLFVGLSAVLALPVIILAGKLMTRHRPDRLVPAMNAVSAVACIVEWMIIRDFPRLTAVLVFFHLNTASAVLVSGFWSIINERFDVTTAKRHIGRIGMGATLGGIVGGIVAERTSAYLEPNAILLVLAGMQGLSAVLLSILGRGAHLKETPGTLSTWSALGGVARSHLLRKAGLVVVATAVGAGALDYVFKADIVHGGSSADLLGSLAIFYTITNIVTAVVQVVLCGPALAMLGVPRTVATLPVTLTGFSVLALFMRVPFAATVATRRRARHPQFALSRRLRAALRATAARAEAPDEGRARRRCRQARRHYLRAARGGRAVDRHRRPHRPPPARRDRRRGQHGDRVRHPALVHAVSRATA